MRLVGLLSTFTGYLTVLVLHLSSLSFHRFSCFLVCCSRRGALAPFAACVLPLPRSFWFKRDVPRFSLLILVRHLRRVNAFTLSPHIRTSTFPAAFFTSCYLFSAFPLSWAGPLSSTYVAFYDTFSCCLCSCIVPFSFVAPASPAFAHYTHLTYVLSLQHTLHIPASPRSFVHLYYPFFYLPRHAFAWTGRRTAALPGLVQWDQYPISFHQRI